MVGQCDTPGSLTGRGSSMEKGGDRQEAARPPPAPQHAETAAAAAGDDAGLTAVSDEAGDTADPQHGPAPATRQPHLQTAAAAAIRSCVMEIPSAGIIYWFTTRASALHGSQTPTASQSGALWTPAGARRGRVLPPARDRARSTSRDVAGTPAASSSSSSATAAGGKSRSYPHTWPRDAAAYGHGRLDRPASPSGGRWYGQPTATIPAASSAPDTHQPSWPSSRHVSASSATGAAAPPVLSTIATEAAEELDLTAGFCVERFRGTAQHQDWKDRPERSDSFETAAKRRRGSTESERPRHAVSRHAAEPGSGEPELAAAAARALGELSVHAGQRGSAAGELSASEGELVAPLSSLRIDVGGTTAATSRRDDGAGDGARKTHPGCSTLLYRRKHHPGLHRPRAFTCSVEGPLHFTPV